MAHIPVHLFVVVLPPTPLQALAAVHRVVKVEGNAGCVIPQEQGRLQPGRLVFLCLS